MRFPSSLPAAPDRAPSPSTGPRSARALAFYLPQFHPIPENDAWWGAGFTEWTNVTAARPRFPGHHQPQLPAELGFYDLRIDDVRMAQAEMAMRHGIHGFCYYHYWFSGRRLLGMPLDRMLASGRPDFPFALCWANQTWSRTWSGREHDVLMRQEYSEDDHRNHIAWLADVFLDPRYIRIEGRPLFLVYLPEAIPDLRQVLHRWRDHCAARMSADPFICGVMTGYSTWPEGEMIEAGLDALVDFQPNWRHFPQPRNLAARVLRGLRSTLPSRWYDALRDNRWLRGREVSTIVDYPAYVDAYLARSYAPGLPIFPCVFPSWDNSARRTAATIIQNDSAADYERWLRAALSRVARYPEDRRLVFINAWNEWAEGCHLEPDRRNGLSMLEATARALRA